MRKVSLEWNKGPTHASGGVKTDWVPPQPESALHEVEPLGPGAEPQPDHPGNRGWTDGWPPGHPVEPGPMGFLRNLQQRSQAMTPTLLGILRNAEGYPHPYPRGGINE